MTKTTRFSLLATGALLALVLALGATAVFAQSDDGGEDAAPADGITVPEGDPTAPEVPVERPGSHGHHGMPEDLGPREGLSSRDELLADALGVDLETLISARGTAWTAAIEQALAEELITEEQAEMLRDRESVLHHRRSLHGLDAAVDHEALLADALDIGVEELEAAEQQAHAAALAEMVDAGYLTEAEAQVMTARQALKGAIDREALLAEVLNLNETEVDEALANRESLATRIEESGLTMDEFHAAMQTAHEAAVAQAVQDGIISAEQYDALQSAGPDSLNLGGRHFGGHGRGGHGRHGGFGENGGPANSNCSPNGGNPPTLAPTVMAPAAGSL
jgi:hypothetical protein